MQNRNNITNKCRYILFFLLEPPSTPQNFSFDPDYTTATDVDVDVYFSWTSSFDSTGSDNESSVTFVINISEATTSYTSTSSFTTRLRLNTTYLIAVYASRCNGALTSDSLISSIIIDQGKL